MNLKTKFLLGAGLMTGAFVLNSCEDEHIETQAEKDAKAKITLQNSVRNSLNYLLNVASPELGAVYYSGFNNYFVDYPEYTATEDSIANHNGTMKFWKGAAPTELAPVMNDVDLVIDLSRICKKIYAEYKIKIRQWRIFYKNYHPTQDLLTRDRHARKPSLSRPIQGQDSFS
ncbi:hypothetical protein AGMMS49525_07690 [Bacteroidia bacterium]|nr:hypothetical protein AGMMS49525_07690 [Bacteroidia bacterium]